MCFPTSGSLCLSVIPLLGAAVCVLFDVALKLGAAIKTCGKQSFISCPGTQIQLESGTCGTQAFVAKGIYIYPLENTKCDICQMDLDQLCDQITC